MKKMKLILLVIVVITAVSGAFAAKKKFACEDLTQYYFANGNYWPAGAWGTNFYCNINPASTCTYYKDANGTYLPCRLGVFVPINPTR